MKTSTFNRVFTVLVILFVMYSVVCAMIAVHSEPIDSMPLYAMIWIVLGLGIVAWSIVYGNKDAKQVYYLKGKSPKWLHDPNDEEFWIRYPDYTDHVGMGRREN